MTEREKSISADALFASLEHDAEYAKAHEQLASKLALARNILRYRAKRNLTQAELARAAGMRQPRIAEIEGAHANPRLDTLDRIARALNATVSDLLRRDPIGHKESMQASVTTIVRTSGIPEHVEDLSLLGYPPMWRTHRTAIEPSPQSRFHAEEWHVVTLDKDTFPE